MRATQIINELATVLLLVCGLFVIVNQGWFGERRRGGEQAMMVRDREGKVGKVIKERKIDPLMSKIKMNLSVLQESEITVYGQQIYQERYLTIGIPSVSRKEQLYLHHTIQGILNNTNYQEQQEVVIFVFLADADEEYNNKILADIRRRYQKEMQAGLLFVMLVPLQVYPDLSNIKRNFGDPPARVHWRSKQNVDFALMFLQAKNLSQYYIQIEDDIQVAEKFVSKIHEFIDLVGANQTHWAVLHFSTLGFIGKLVRSRDLEKFAKFLMTFYDEQPVDWLLDHFERSMAQPKHIYRTPSIFQHIGDVSSLNIKPKALFRDNSFIQHEKPTNVKKMNQSNLI